MKNNILIFNVLLIFICGPTELLGGESKSFIRLCSDSILSDSISDYDSTAHNGADTIFVKYLKEFQIALMMGNREKITEMTNFPFWYYYMEPKWRDRKKFSKSYDLIFETEVIQSIMYAQLGQEIKTNQLDGTVEVMRVTNEDELKKLKKKFNLDSNVFYELSYGFTIDPDRAIDVFSFYYFGLTNNGFKLLGKGFID